jgi:hypothetical protein
LLSTITGSRLKTLISSPSNFQHIKHGVPPAPGHQLSVPITRREKLGILNPFFGLVVTAPDDPPKGSEWFLSPRAVPQPPSRTPTSATTMTCGRNPRALSTAGTSDLRPTSQMSGTLGSPNGSLTRVLPPHPATGRVVEKPWEEEVEHIYENGLEAYCDLEWIETLWYTLEIPPPLCLQRIC